jgi:hypothetical protein
LLSEVHLIAASVKGGLGVHEQGNNETVKTQNFGENENQNHSDEKAGLLRGSSDTSITNNTNGETGGKTSKTDGQTSAELNEARVQGKVLLQAIGDKDRHDETVDTNDTSHNDGDNVLDDKIRSEDTHGGNTDTRLGSTVRGTQAGEDNSAGAAHSTEEGRVNGAVFGDHLGGICVAKARELKSEETWS